MICKQYIISRLCIGCATRLAVAAYFSRAEALVATHKFGDAIAAFQLGLQLDPDDAACQQGLQRSQVLYVPYTSAYLYTCIHLYTCTSIYKHASNINALIHTCILLLLFLYLYNPIYKFIK